MHSKSKRFLSLLLVCLLSMAVLVGCQKEVTDSKSNAGNEATKPDTVPADTSGLTEEVTYPIKTTEVLTYWVELNPTLVAPNFKNLGDTEFAKQLEKETGVKVEYIHPAVGAGIQAFNLLVASGNMPDIIEYGWSKATGGYPGGPEAAIRNKVIRPLNEYLEKGSIEKVNSGLQK